MKQTPFSKNEPTLEEIRRLSSFKKAFRWMYDTGIQRGESTGWPSVDTHYTVRPREWTLLTGIPGHGKTTWLDNLMVNLSRRDGWRWAVFSAENLPVERHAASLAAKYIGRPFGPHLRQRIDEEELRWAEMFIEDHFRWLNPIEEDCTIGRILMLATMLAEHRDESGMGIQGLVIDPWNELDHSRPQGLSETEYISGVLTKIRRFARNHEVHVFLVAHPTKMQRVKADVGATEAQVYPVPTPYDVSGSAHFRNKADNCICVWRDVMNTQNDTQIHVQKIRFGEVGKVGVVQLAFDEATGQYIDPKVGLPRLFKKPNAEQMRSGLMAVAGISREPGDES